MNIPRLNPSHRSREYDSYSDDLRSLVVKGWLFDGKTHRELDRDVLGLDSKNSKGYQSMGILHYLGLKKEFRGIFAHTTVDSAITMLNSNDQDFTTIVDFISANKQFAPIKLSDFIDKENKEIEESQKDTSENRKKRIEASQRKPKRIRLYSYAYERNTDIVAEALYRARGICECCKKLAPFVRASDNTPYLEVHHIKPLGNGGDDTIENVVALCPNCHKKEHYGKS